VANDFACSIQDAATGVDLSKILGGATKILGGCKLGLILVPGASVAITDEIIEFLN